MIFTVTCVVQHTSIAEGVIYQLHSVTSCKLKRYYYRLEHLNEINVKKTAVYTNVNGEIVSYTSKTAKIKKDDITQQHIDTWRYAAG